VPDYNKTDNIDKPP